MVSVCLTERTLWAHHMAHVVPNVSSLGVARFTRPRSSMIHLDSRVFI